MFFDPIVADNQMPQWIVDGDARINDRGRIVFKHVRSIYAGISDFNFDPRNGVRSTLKAKSERLRHRHPRSPGGGSV